MVKLVTIAVFLAAALLHKIQAQLTCMCGVNSEISLDGLTRLVSVKTKLQNHLGSCSSEGECSGGACARVALKLDDGSFVTYHGCWDSTAESSMVCHAAVIQSVTYSHDRFLPSPIATERCECSDQDMCNQLPGDEPQGTSGEEEEGSENGSGGSKMSMGSFVGVIAMALLFWML